MLQQRTQIDSAVNSVDKRSNQSKRWLIGCATIVVSLIYVYSSLDQGWVPHDEGQLGQAAERVLAGEISHRDFDDMYTGALSYLNGFSFWLWGINSLSMRLMLFVWFVPFLVSIYWLFSELTEPVSAGLLTMLAATWSIPMYAGAMPSWYNLFFSAWALSALIQFVKHGQRFWLLLVGLFIGGSILFKISGVFLLAGTLLFVFYFRQTNRPRNNGRHSTDVVARTSSQARLFSVLASIALGLSSLLCLKFVHGDPLMQIVHFVVPFVGLTGFVIWREWNIARGSFRERFVDLVGDMVPLSIGVAVPVGLFVGFYAYQDALGDLANGLFVLPGKRLASANFPFPAFATLIASIPVLVLLFASVWYRGSRVGAIRKNLAILAGVATLAMLVISYNRIGFIFGLFTFRNLGPILVLGNLLALSFMRQQISERKSQLLFLLTVVPFFSSLIQFPFAAPIYFFYSAPLLVATALMAVEVQPWAPRRALGLVVVGFVLWTCARLHSPVNGLSPHFEHHLTSRLNTERCQLVVDSRDAMSVNRLQVLVNENSIESETVFATPDIPEVAFLFNRRPLNGVMYEFFREEMYEDLEGLRSKLDQRNVRLVVINELPQFSEHVGDEFRKVVLSGFDLIEEVMYEVQGVEIPRYTVYRRRKL